MTDEQELIDQFNYGSIPTITRYVVPQKQAVKRHYGSHQYFTKRAWNVIQEYIDNYTKPGDTICDPYGGSGVTIVEALVLGRRGVYLDVSAWAGFLASQVAIAPVDLAKLSEAFKQIEDACSSQLKDWWALSEEESEKVPLTNWFPKDYPLPRNADVRFVHELFSHKQLLVLSELLYQIGLVEDEISRNLLRYVFSATLYMCNRTFISANGRKESRGGSSIFSIYRYKVAKRAVNLDPWEVFSGRFKKLMACKRETNHLIGDREGGSNNAQFLKGYAQNLSEYIGEESVDYIFTDPPYGAHIAYLLTKLGRAAGFSCHVGKKEQSSSYKDESFASLSVKQLSFARSASSFSKGKIQQIDLIWMDGGRPSMAFEIEHSTPITTGIDRFIELLRVDQNMAEHLVLVAPKSRKRKLDEVLSDSHYIGAPMYMEAKVRYLWYSDVIDLLEKFATQQPDKPTLLSAVLKMLKAPNPKRD